MSMIMTLKQAPPRTLDLLVERPELALVFWMNPDYEKPVQPGWLVWIAKLLGHYQPPLDLPDAPTDFARNGEQLCLDKAWHGLHWLLTRPHPNDWEAPPPEGTLLTAGQVIEGSDHGYGDDRAVAPPQVADYDALLQAIAWDDLEQQYAPEAMDAAGVYPNNWSEDPTWADDLKHYYQQLQNYIHETAKQGLGLVIQLS